MTCKDCIHSEICLEQYSQLNPDTMFNKCKKFKNKADFVEVVRCSKCKQWIKSSNLPTDTSGFCFYHYIDTNENDFCNYRERKDGKDINVPTK